MEWVGRYLDQVGQYLPEDKREEVTQELREAIEGELEGLAESREGAVTGADEKAILARFGHPQKVAQSYHPLRYLIGPELYPVWWQTIKQVAAVVLGIQVVIALVAGAVAGWNTGIKGTLNMIVEGQIWAFLVVTGVFVALEFSGERLKRFERWTPDQLPAQSVAPIQRGDVFTNLFGEAVFLLWWNDVLLLTSWFPDFIQHFPIKAGPMWDVLFWPLNLVFGAAFILHAWVLFRGVWQRPTLSLEVIVNLAVIALAAVLILSPELVIVQPLPSEEALNVLGRGAYFIEWTLKVSIAVIAAVCAWDCWKAYRLLR